MKQSGKSNVNSFADLKPTHDITGIPSVHINLCPSSHQTPRMAPRDHLWLAFASSNPWASACASAPRGAGPTWPPPPRLCLPLGNSASINSAYWSYWRLKIQLSHGVARAWPLLALASLVWGYFMESGACQGLGCTEPQGCSRGSGGGVGGTTCALLGEGAQRSGSPAGRGAPAGAPLHLPPHPRCAKDPKSPLESFAKAQVSGTPFPLGCRDVSPPMSPLGSPAQRHSSCVL